MSEDCVGCGKPPCELCDRTRDGHIAEQMVAKQQGYRAGLAKAAAMIDATQKELMRASSEVGFREATLLRSEATALAKMAERIRTEG